MEIRYIGSIDIADRELNASVMPANFYQEQVMELQGTRCIGSQDASFLLRSVVATLLGTGLTVVAPIAVAQSYCNINGCVVTAPGRPGGDLGGGGGGGWGGGASTSDQCSTRHCDDAPKPDPCPTLLATKPSSCPNPIPMPSGFNYGRSEYAGGSGIAKALYFISNQKGVSPAARASFKLALEKQTTNFAKLTVPFDRTMKETTQMLTQACGQQREWSGRNAYLRPPSVLTAADKQCLQTVDRITAEANNRQGFWSWFVGWTEKDGISLGDLGIPQTVINATSPQNSVRVKHNKVTEDAKCSNWWRQVQRHNCPI